MVLLGDPRIAAVSLHVESGYANDSCIVQVLIEAKHIVDVNDIRFFRSRPQPEERGTGTFSRFIGIRSAITREIHPFVAGK